MRTLSLEAHRELSNLLKQIDSQVGVIGTLIVGHDGLLIANTMPQDMEAESLSKWAQAIYMGTAQTTEQLGNERVRQIVSQTERGYLIIANFGAGLLIAVTNPLMVDHLLPLMRTITQLVAS
jgi:predicted regulator of Ras-like GTPase activity (Roadblock/LC7/MglB family)